jgi:hypothetical protein
MRMEVDFTMTKRNKHIGSSLNSFLKEEGILEETRAIALKAAVVVQDAEAYQRLLDIRAQPQGTHREHLRQGGLQGNVGPGDLPWLSATVVSTYSPNGLV